MVATTVPPGVVPSCIRMVLMSVSMDSSPTAPVKALFCVVVPLLNCTCDDIINPLLRIYTLWLCLCF